MKRGLIVALTGVLAALGAGALMAQPGGGGGGGGMEGGPGRGGPFAELGAEQRAAMRQAWRAHRDAVTPLKDKLEDELEKLKGLVEKAAPEKDLNASVDKVKELHKAIQAEREKLMDKMGAQLTPMQRAKGVLMMARRFGRGHGMGGGPGFGMRGRGGHGGGPGWGPRGGGGGGGPRWKDAPNDDDDDGPGMDDDGEGPEQP